MRFNTACDASNKTNGGRSTRARVLQYGHSSILSIDTYAGQLKTDDASGQPLVGSSDSSGLGVLICCVNALSFSRAFHCSLMIGPTPYKDRTSSERRSSDSMKAKASAYIERLFGFRSSIRTPSRKMPLRTASQALLRLDFGIQSSTKMCRSHSSSREAVDVSKIFPSPCTPIILSSRPA